MVWLLYLAWLVLNIAINIVAPSTIPYSGAFPYVHILDATGLPRIIFSRANFDGVHYILIALQGYSQYEQAFFPVYPLLIKALNVVIHNYLISGLIVSVTSFSLALCVLQKFLTQLFNSKKTLWIIGLLLAFPSSFYFVTVYTEALFLLLLSLTLYWIYKKNWYLAAAFAYVTALTRFIGVFLIIPFVIMIIMEDITRKKIGSISRYVLSLTPVLGLASYMWYLYRSSGDALNFLHSQTAFGAHRSSSIILLPQVLFRYGRILGHSDMNFPLIIAIFELSVFIFIFIVLSLDLLNIIKNKVHVSSPILLGINLFSFVNLLLPTLTGTFSSIPRYALFSLSTFLYLGQLKNSYFKIIMVLIFLTLHILMFGFFLQGYFVS